MTDDSASNTPEQSPFIPVGKIRCFVTGKLRNDTPEENVRQRWARSLAYEYGYDIADMDIEFRVKMGSSRKKQTSSYFDQGDRGARTQSSS